MHLLVRRCLRRSYLVEEFVETWQIEHSEAMLAFDLDEIVHECLDLGKLLQYVWPRLLKLLFNEQIDDIETTGRVFQSAMERALRVFSRVQGLVAYVKEKGYPLGESEELDKIAMVSKQLVTDFQERWPLFSQKMLLSSLAAFKKGEYQTTEDILNGLQSRSAKAH